MHTTSMHIACGSKHCVVGIWQANFHNTVVCVHNVFVRRCSEPKSRCGQRIKLVLMLKEFHSQARFVISRNTPSERIKKKKDPQDFSLPTSIDYAGHNRYNTPSRSHGFPKYVRQRELLCMLRDRAAVPGMSRDRRQHNLQHMHRRLRGPSLRASHEIREPFSSMLGLDRNPT